MKKLEVLPKAVRHILAGARKEQELPHLLAKISYSDIRWITSSAPQHFRASTDEDYIREQFGTVANEIVNYPPPKTLVEEAPRCFTALAVMHPEAALLGYVCEHKVDMSGYMGSSPPICYPCVMLLHAFNVRAGWSHSVGVSQCSFRIPIPWCPPPMDSLDVLEYFRDSLREDYDTVYRNERASVLQDRNWFW